VPDDHELALDREPLTINPEPKPVLAWVRLYDQAGRNSLSVRMRSLTGCIARKPVPLRAVFHVESQDRTGDGRRHASDPYSGSAR
jgi:hypothetical protein